MEFYGYKKCSTCRNAHRALKDAGIDVDFEDFVDEPPSVSTLRQWVGSRGEGVEPFINRKGTRFKELDLASKTLTNEEWILLLSQDGKLLKRPVLVTDSEVITGFDKAAYDRVILAHSGGAIHKR